MEAFTGSADLADGGTADGRSRAALVQLVVVRRRAAQSSWDWLEPVPRMRELVRSALKETRQRVAVDAQVDAPLGAVDLGDRVCRHHAPRREEAARPHRESIGLVGTGAVHRALDAAEQTARGVRDAEADRRTEIDVDRAHGTDRIPRLQGKCVRTRKGFVNGRHVGFVVIAQIATTYAIRSATLSTVMTRAPVWPPPVRIRRMPTPARTRLMISTMNPASEMTRPIPTQFWSSVNGEALSTHSAPMRIAKNAGRTTKQRVR